MKEADTLKEGEGEKRHSWQDFRLTVRFRNMILKTEIEMPNFWNKKKKLLSKSSVKKQYVDLARYCYEMVIYNII
jgi:hypothetical protein